MMNLTGNEQQGRPQYQLVREACKKVREIRGFYIHLLVYCIAIPAIIVVNVVFVPQFHWFWFPMFGWGMGLAFHGFEAFGFLPFAGRNWEQRKMARIIAEEGSSRPLPEPGQDKAAASWQQQQRYDQARKRVRQISGFYRHLAAYLVINGISLVANGFDLKPGEPFFTFSNFSLAFFWGIGLAMHALNTFGLQLFFGKAWEDRQIRKFMDQEKESVKYWE